MAYAALISLMHTIEGLLHTYTISIASSTRKSLRLAYEHAESLKDAVWGVGEGMVRDVDERIIIEETRRLEDAIEFPLSLSPPSFSSDLVHHINCFIQTTNKSMEIIEEQKAAAKMAQKEREKEIEELIVQKTVNEDVEMVGLSDQFFSIRDCLLKAQADRDLFGRSHIWITGMAGIGKTVLAKKLFHDPLVKTNFQHRVFISIGQKCPSPEKFWQATEIDFGTETCLIVLDDVWNPYLLNNLAEVKQIPVGFTFLVTSRKQSHFNNVKMRFMNKEESWELLRRKVFEEEGEECPPQLVKAGNKIAEKCEGLPLLINAVASILRSKINNDPASWNRVANKPNSVLEEASHQISQVLLKSYHHLNDNLKVCFLYIVAFPLNCKVFRSTIINLWDAEGFHYFEYEFYFNLHGSNDTYRVLIEQSLVMENLKSLGETKVCSLHCAYWFVSRRLAENNKFLYVINSCSDVWEDGVKSHRRLAIQENVLLAIKEVYDKIACISTVRSLLCTGPYNQYQVPICVELKLLRVLHALSIRFYEFPVELVKLIRLRYLALTCNADLPCSISKLWCLEFLIISQHWRIKRVATDTESYLPMEIWDLGELKHLEIMGRNLPEPRPGAVLPNLRKLLDVGVESCTKGVLESIPQLEKLRIRKELPPNAPETFNHVSSHAGLISFQSDIVNPTLLIPPPPLTFLSFGLQKLSLSGFGYPWEDMSKIAALLNLRKLKLQCYAFRGEKWNANEMEFPHLEYILIEDTDLVQWETPRYSFPCLSMLTMKHCYKLRDIPRIPSVRYIELVDCNPLAETCARKGIDPELSYPEVSAKYSWIGKN